MPEEEEKVYNVFYQGLHALELDAFTRGQVESLCSRYGEKIAYLIKNINKINVHFKAYQKEGKKQKYSVHVLVDYPGQVITSTKAHDWDIKRAVHKAFKDIENQMRHKFKQSLK